MHERHYADSRDAFKWSVVMRAARERGVQTVVWAAMRPADRESKSLRSADARFEKTLVEFFQRERDAHFPVSEVPHLREFVGAIENATGLSIAFVDGDYGGTVAEREEYANAVRARVAACRPAGGSPLLLLIDPDTGVSRTERSSVHVHPDHIPIMCGNLTRGDTALIYQTQDRVKSESESKWYERKCADANTAGLVFSVRDEGLRWANVALLRCDVAT